MKVAAAIALLVASLIGQGADDNWLTWPATRAEAIGKAAYVRGRVGGFFDTRFLKTERSYNYKLAATWLSPDVIRATARMRQAAERLPADETKALFAEAEAAAVGGTVVMVEIDPREGSGVIPNDWAAFLRAETPGSATPREVRGVDTPRLREVKALAGVLRRNYDYDRFWMVFPLTHTDGKPLFESRDQFAELVVLIAGKEGRVRWPIPQSLR